MALEPIEYVHGAATNSSHAYFTCHYHCFSSILDTPTTFIYFAILYIHTLHLGLDRDDPAQQCDSDITPSSILGVLLFYLTIQL